jgi:hypothetical protein
MRQHFIVLAIRSGDIVCAEWSSVCRLEHFLQLLNLVDDAFNVHGSQSSSTKRESVKLKRGIGLATTIRALQDFGFAGILRGAIAGLPWSHGLFMSVIWSVAGRQEPNDHSCAVATIDACSQ